MNNNIFQNNNQPNQNAGNNQGIPNIFGTQNNQQRQQQGNQNQGNQQQFNMFANNQNNQQNQQNRQNPVQITFQNQNQQQNQNPSQQNNITPQFQNALPQNNQIFQNPSNQNTQQNQPQSQPQSQQNQQQTGSQNPNQGGLQNIFQANPNMQINQQGQNQLQPQSQQQNVNFQQQQMPGNQQPQQGSQNPQGSQGQQAQQQLPTFQNNIFGGQGQQAQNAAMPQFDKKAEAEMKKIQQDNLKSQNAIQQIFTGKIQDAPNSQLLKKAQQQSRSPASSQQMTQSSSYSDSVLKYYNVKKEKFRKWNLKGKWDGIPIIIEKEIKYEGYKTRRQKDEMDWGIYRFLWDQMDMKNEKSFEYHITLNNDKIVKNLIEGIEHFNTLGPLLQPVIEKDKKQQQPNSQQQQNTQTVWQCSYISTMKRESQKFIECLIDQIAQYLNIKQEFAKRLVDSNFAKEFHKSYIKNFLNWINDNISVPARQNLMYQQVQYISQRSMLSQHDYSHDNQQIQTMILIRENVFSEYQHIRNWPLRFLSESFQFEQRDRVDYPTPNQCHPAIQFFHKFHVPLIQGLINQYIELSNIDLTEKMTEKHRDSIMKQFFHEQVMILESLINLIEIFEYEMPKTEFMKIFKIMREQNFQGNWILYKTANQDLQISDGALKYCEQLSEKLSILSQTFVLVSLDIHSIFAFMNCKQNKIVRQVSEEFENCLFNQIMQDQTDRRLLLDDYSQQMTFIKFFCVRILEFFNANFGIQPQLLQFSDDPINILRSFMKQDYFRKKQNSRFQSILSSIFIGLVRLLTGFIEAGRFQTLESVEYLNLSTKICNICFKVNDQLLIDYFDECTIKFRELQCASQNYQHMHQEYDENTQKLEDFSIFQFYQWIYNQKLTKQTYSFLKNIIYKDWNQYNQTDIILMHLHKYLEKDDKNSWNSEIFGDWNSLIQQIYRQQDPHVYEDIKCPINIDFDLQTRGSFLKQKIKLVCKILTNIPTSLEKLEQNMFDLNFYTLRGNQESSYRGIGILILLFDTFYYLSRFKDVQFGLLDYILSAITEIVKIPRHRQLVINLLQLYPSTIKDYEYSQNPHPLMNFFVNLDFTTKGEVNPKKQSQKLKLIEKYLIFCEELFEQSDSILHDFPIKPIQNIQQLADIRPDLHDTFTSQFQLRFTNAHEARNIHYQIYNFQNEQTYQILTNHILQVPSRILENCLTFIYVNLFPYWETLANENSQKKHKYKICERLLSITNQFLQQFIINPDYVSFSNQTSADIYSDFKYEILQGFINNAPVTEAIIKIFEVHHKKTSTQPDLSNYYLHIEGEKSQTMVQAACHLLITIMDLIDSFQNNGIQQGISMEGLICVKDFYDILFFTPQSEKYNSKICVNYDSNSSYNTKINFVQALVAAVTFDNIESQDDFTLKNQAIDLVNLLNIEQSEQSEVIEEHYIKFFERNEEQFDFHQYKSLLNKKKCQSGFFKPSISICTIRTLTRLLVLWEQRAYLYQEPKICLFDKLTNFPTIDSENILKNINLQQKNFKNVLVYKLMQEYLANKLSVMDYSGYELGAICDFLLVCINSQKQIVDTLFRKQTINLNDNYYQGFMIMEHPHDSIVQAFHNWFFEASSDQFRTTQKMTYLMQEIFKKSNFYADLCQKLKNTPELFTQMFEKIGRILRIQSQNQRINEQEEYNYIKDNFQKNMICMLRKVIKESMYDQVLVSLDCFTVFMKILTAENGREVTKTLKLIFERILDMKHEFQGNIGFTSYTKNFCSQLVESLKEDSPNLFNQQLIKVDQIDKVKRQQKGNANLKIEIISQNSSIMFKDFYPFIDVNAFGYGRDYIFDTNQMISYLLQHKVSKSQQPEQFFKDISRIIVQVQNFNVVSSVFKIEEKLLEQVEKIFTFISTTSYTNLAGSATLCSQNLLFHLETDQSNKNGQLIQSLIDHDDQLLKLLLPNYHLKFNTDFIEILSLEKTPSSIDYTFKNNREILDAFMYDFNNKIYEESEIPAFNTKMQIVTTAFANMIYMMKYQRLKMENEEINQNSQQPKKSTKGFYDKFDEREIYNYNDFFISMLQKAQDTDSDIDLRILIQGFLYFLSFVECLDQEMQDQLVLINPNEAPKNLVNRLLDEDNKNEISKLNHFYNLKKLLRHHRTQESLILIIICLTKLIKLSGWSFLLFVKYDSDDNDSFLKQIFHYYFPSNERENPHLHSAISKLLIEFCWLEDGEGAKMLFQYNFHKQMIRQNKFLAMNDKMEDLYFAGDQVDGQYTVMRSEQHLNWCWTIAFYKEFVLAISDHSKCFCETLEFLVVFQRRIVGILQFPLHLPQNKYRIKLDQQMNIQVSEQCCREFTAAVIYLLQSFFFQYLQELDLILQLLNVFYTESSNFRLRLDGLFELYLQIIQKDTCLLFDMDPDTLPNGLNDLVRPVTLVEKQLHSIQWNTYDQYRLNFGRNKQIIQRASLRNYAQQIQQNKVYSENKSLFIFGIELQYLDIMNAITSIFKYSLHQSRMIELIEKTTTLSYLPEWLELDTDATVLEQFANSLYLMQKFVQDTLGFWYNEEQKAQTLTNALFMIQNAQNSVQYQNDSSYLTCLKSTKLTYENILDQLVTICQLFSSSVTHLQIWKNYRQKYQTLSCTEIIQNKDSYEQSLGEIFISVYRFLSHQLSNKLSDDLAQALYDFDFGCDDISIEGTIIPYYQSMLQQIGSNR